MNWMQLSFDQPWWLLLLALLPMIWITGWKSLSGLGRLRFWLALGFRSALLVLLVCALAEIQLVRISQRIVALFLIDQSTSVALTERNAAFDYANAVVAKHRDSAKQDAAGVIVFGANAQIEHAPAADGPLPKQLESTVEDGRTNLAAALRLAKASFPAEAAKRVIILSDGNQNLGDALIEASDLAAAGIGIDVAPLQHGPQGDVVVERVTAPAGARVGTVFDVQVLVDYRLPPANEFRPQPAQQIAGKLVIYRKSSGHTELLAEQRVELRPGKQMYQFRQQLTEAAFYTYEAKFLPDDMKADHYVQNNSASAFTHLQGRGRVLLIVSAENPQEFDGLAALFRKNELEVTVQPTNALFGSLAELQNYDCVVLGNVGRTTGTQTAYSQQQTDELVQFTDEQVSMLVKNVEQLGAGLVMIGGPDSFGAGGWANTELEKALPVDLQVKNSKVAAVGALMLVIDKSGSMNGEKLELSKAAANAAVGMLGPLDSIGVIAFDDGHDEVITLQKVGGNAHRIKDRIKRIGPGGGTNMESGLKRGYDQLIRSKASTKHLIILTDGQTAGSGYQQQASNMLKRHSITTTTVAVGTDASKSLLQEIAVRGAGKYYQATNPKVLPKIFVHETRRVVRPLVYESEAGLSLSHVRDHEILAGISSQAPPITGYVLTTLKENPLVEAPLLAPAPGAPNNTVLATWTYGLGRSVVFTTDIGQRWTRSWDGWEDRDKLFLQMVRWSMRPLLDQGNFIVNSQVRDGELEVNVQALTSGGDFVNNLSMTGGLIGAEGTEQGDLQFEQTGPGKYRARAQLDKPGTYLVGIQPGPGMGVLRTGVNVPSSAEYRDTSTNETLLASLAQLKPTGGKAGEFIRLPEDSQTWGKFTGPNLFRRDLQPGRGLTSIWPMVVLAGACLFFFDVLNRRVQIPWGEAATAMSRLTKRKAAVTTAHPIDRLQAIKRRAREQNEPSRRWAPPVMDEEAARESSTVAIVETPSTVSPQSTSPQPEQEQYSDRLLRKLREVRAKERDRKPDA